MLKLYFHPLASFCWKPLIALYESGVAFEPIVVDLGDATSRASFATVWPLAKFPVLRDDARNRTIAESSAIAAYLAAFHPGSGALVPKDADVAIDANMWDSVCDSYLQAPMQKVVADSFRPTGASDPHGVAESRALIRQAYDLLDARMASRTFLAGESMTTADCSAAPALFYCDLLEPLKPRWPALSGYLDRLMARPSFARVLDEAEPFFTFYPLTPKPSKNR
jgi:glutathione S-transferase